jgi:hypothetical protein
MFNAVLWQHSCSGKGARRRRLEQPFWSWTLLLPAVPSPFWDVVRMVTVLLKNGLQERFKNPGLHGRLMDPEKPDV